MDSPNATNDSTRTQPSSSWACQGNPIISKMRHQVFCVSCCFCGLQSEWPDDLKSFVVKCVEYSLEREVDDDVVGAIVSVDVSVSRGMNPKKQHEVYHSM